MGVWGPYISVLPKRADHGASKFWAPGEISISTPTRRTWNRPVELDQGAGDHEAVYRSFHESVLSGAPLFADGISSRMSLELANAMIYSSHRHREVTFPLDRRAYDDLYSELCKGEAEGV